MNTVVETDDLRTEVRQWLAAHWRPDVDQAEWLAAVVDRGYAAPRWPRAWYGLDLDDAAATVIEDEFRAAGAPGGGQDRVNMYANTVLVHGNDDLRRRFLRPLLLGEMRMCLLYSEPGAGSDLAGLRTTAKAVGAEYIVDGQKVWTSHAAEADYGMLVARTDPDVPKHRGISFFFVPIKQAGVEVRPLRQMTGESRFNEVFLTGARVPAANMLGEPGQGWRVLQTALAYERAMLATFNRGAVTRSGRESGELAAEVDLIALARRHDRLRDPLVRQDIARVMTLRAVRQWNNQRAQAELAHGSSSPVASLGKLLMSRLLHETGRVQTEIVGPEAMFEGPDHVDGDEANFAAMNAFFTSIGGGTDQIQRNIVGERILGLPKEPDPYRDVPFRNIRKSG